MANLRKDFTPLAPGETYLTITGIPYWQTNKRRRVLAVCRCGVIKEYDYYKLICKTVKSCGCYRVEYNMYRPKTHGDVGSALYRVWCSMKTRCYCKTTPGYKGYGARGITMCEDWKNNYSSFREWAIQNNWKRGLHIDRVDNDCGYCPGNCRIVTGKQNSRNRRNTIKITFKGETKAISEWAEIYKIPYCVLFARYKRGRGINESFFTRKVT